MFLTVGHPDHSFLRYEPSKAWRRRSALWVHAGSLFFLFGLCAVGQSSAASITTNINPSWTRPTTAANAASTLTTYAEWDGFAVTATTNQPTGNSAFGNSLFVPTAGDSSSSTSGSFLLPDGTANNSYYSGTSIGDIYSFGAVITPQIIVPGYNVAGNQLNVLVQVEAYGAVIDTSSLTANGITASTLPNYSVTETYTDGGQDVGFGTAYRNDYAWTFTLPSDTASLQLNFGWGEVSAAFVSAVVDTQSVPVPEPSALLLGSLAGALLWMTKRKPLA